jgi:hypothetical protein
MSEGCAFLSSFPQSFELMKNSKDLKGENLEELTP